MPHGPSYRASARLYHYCNMIEQIRERVYLQFCPRSSRGVDWTFAGCGGSEELISVSQGMVPRRLRVAAARSFR
jgi:hypothetical protein